MQTNQYEPKIQLFQGSSLNILAFLIAFDVTTADCIISHFPGHKSTHGYLKVCEGLPRPGSSIVLSLYKESNGKFTLDGEYNGKALNLCLNGSCSHSEAVSLINSSLLD
jgi:hypothetical protein